MATVTEVLIVWVEDEFSLMQNADGLATVVAPDDMILNHSTPPFEDETKLWV